MKFIYLIVCIFLFKGIFFSQNEKILEKFKNYPFNDTTIIISNVKVDFLFPKSELKGTILVLPGWNFERNDICKKSNFCELARNNGYILVMPDMKKSIYIKELFPETRTDWRSYPTLLWLTDTMIPWIQQHFKILMSKQKNFLFGISTGARGVAMISLYSDNIFLAGACLSGDYNQVEMKNDNLVRGYCGDFDKFPDRWNGVDNPSKNASKLKIPLFLAHGKEDNIVPFSQTTDFFTKIVKLNPDLGHEIDIKENSGHNYEFWSLEYEAVFIFFETHSR